VARPIFHEVERWQDLRGMTSWPYKLVWNFDLETGSAAR
jgi:hypothetical protein